MFSHIMLGTSDLAKAKTFYDAVLGTLDVGPSMLDGHRMFYRTPTGILGISLPIDDLDVVESTGHPILTNGADNCGFAVTDK